MRRVPWFALEVRRAPVTLARVLWHSHPALTLFAAAWTVWLGVQPALSALALGRLVAGLDAGASLADLGAPLAAVVGLLIANVSLGAVAGALLAALAWRVDRAVGARLLRSAAQPWPLDRLEDPRTLDRWATVRGESGGLSAGSAVSLLVTVSGRRLAALSGAVLLATWALWLPLWVLAALLPLRLWLLREIRLYQESVELGSTGLRRAAYFRDLALQPAAAREVRVFGLSGWVQGRFGRAANAALARAWQRRGRNRTHMLLSALTAALGFGVTAALLVESVLTANLDIGRLTALLQGAFVMLALVDGLENDLQVGRALLPFRALSALPSGCEEDADGAEAAPALRRDLRLEAVRFRYPGAERDALNIAALRLEAGQVVALVGPNGAGKSTLTRLLAGLYRPRSGRLEVDGVDLAGVPLEAWRQRVAVVFQDFVRWELSVRENLQLGCPGYALSDAALWELLRAAGAEDSVRALPAGLDTVLSCRFAQGRELSGGQWQRIAIARALAAVRGGARLLILDEPTAALDVRAETEFYARFLELTRGVTTVLVSHRYATVRLADRVLVIGRGRLLEDGPREALLCTGGWFARMARRQAADFDVAP